MPQSTTATETTHFIAQSFHKLTAIIHIHKSKNHVVQNIKLHVFFFFLFSEQPTQQSIPMSVQGHITLQNAKCAV